MKKIKKIFVLFSLVVGAVSLFGMSAAAFSDTDGCRNEQIIERWADAGLISGFPDGTFRPDDAVTRAQFAKIITDLFVLDGVDAEFSDVTPDAWYYPYIEKAAGYITGNETGMFMPSAPLDMADAVKTLSLLTDVEDKATMSLSGQATRSELIYTINTILGGETGFLYMVSVIDSHLAEEDEIMPLVTLSEDTDMATINDEGQVLLLSWHSYPESYIPGTQFTCEYGEMWAFTDKEVLLWYDENREGVTDWVLRFEQLLGLPSKDGKTHVSAFWVDPFEIIRPSYQTDITEQMTPELLDGSALGENKEWFEQNEVYSYETSAYPWTRLGYTYDWFEDENEYGLTEFIILPDSVIDVEWTMSFDEFIAWLEEN